METEIYHYYHVYLRGNHQEDIFYKSSDYINAINRLAIAAYNTNTTIWALEYLSNHFHLVIYSNNRSGFMHYYRMSLSQWYNKENKVSGTVGKRRYGWGNITDPSVDGGEDLKDAIAYTLRNCKKHEIQDDFYSYKWSTFRLYFQKTRIPECISRIDAASFLPTKHNFPEEYRISKHGMILPQDYIDVKGVERLFGTIEKFHEYLSKQTNREQRNPETRESDIKAQTKTQKEVKRITILDNTISEAMIAILEDNALKNRNSPKTIPQMTFNEKIEMGKYIKSLYPQCTIAQLSRILLIPKSTLWQNITGHLRHHSVRTIKNRP